MKTRKWGRWEAAEGLFDQGGQGQVYLVVDSTGQLPGTFVLKELKNPHRRGRFENEVKAIASLAPHPNVVSLIDSGIYRDEKKPCYVMPRADGGSLEAFLKCESLDVGRLLDLFDQVVQGIEHVHAAGIIHRDIKPENILIFGGTPKVSDLGLALISDAPRLTPLEEAVGPRFYMAPELEDGRFLDVTVRADLYSLGKVLYFMLSSGRVFAREKQQRREWSLSEQYQDERYNLFRSIQRRTIAESAADRYASAAELLVAVRAARAQYAEHPATRLRGKIPGIVREWTGTIGSLTQLDAQEWAELLAIRRAREAPYSAELLQACRAAMHASFAGLLAIEILRHKTYLSESEFVDWCVKLVELGNRGDDGFIAMNDCWQHIYAGALTSGSTEVANMVACHEPLPSLKVLTLLARQFGQLCPDAQQSVLTSCVTTAFDGREPLLLRVSHTDLAIGPRSLVVAGLMKIASEACLDRVAELLRGVPDNDTSDALLEGILFGKDVKTLPALLARGGFSERVRKTIETLAELGASSVPSDNDENAG